MSLEIKLHPVAERFPAEKESRIEILAEQIQRHGQLQPALAVKGKVNGDVLIFDDIGRSVHLACQKLKRETEFKLIDGDAAEIATKLLLSRQHFSESQRAALAVPLEIKYSAEARKRQSQAGKLKAKLPEASAGQARDLAARDAGCSPRYISDAKKIYLGNKNLYEDLIAGKLTVVQAKRELQRRADLGKLEADAEEIVRQKSKSGQWEIRTGDCRQLLTEIKRRSIPLIVADPPYNIGKDYKQLAVRRGDKNRSGPCKSDLLDEADYLKIIGAAIRECADVLTPNGQMFFIINHENAAKAEIIIKRAGLTIVDWITWYEFFGNNCTGKLSRTSRRILHAVKNPDDFVLNREHLVQPGKAAADGDKRRNPNGKMWDDVWVIDRLVSGKEKLPGFPTQLPLALLAPIVNGFSNPGDLILDPFSGSATTGASAIAAGRRYLGIEINPQYADLSRARLKRVEEGAGQ